PGSSVGDHTVQVFDACNNLAPPSTFTVTRPGSEIGPTSGPACQPVTVTGSGFAPSTNVTVVYDGYAVAGGTTDATGNINQFQFNVPISSVGDHTVQVVDGCNNQAAQTYTVGGPAAPIFTSADHTSFTVDIPASFTVTTNGCPPVETITETGDLPDGVTFTDNGDGTATLSGTPGPGTAKDYPLTLTASNSIPADA